MTTEEQLAQLQKTVEDLKKVSDEKIATLEKNLETTSGFVQDASVLISVITQNADLKGKVKDAVEGFGKKPEDKKEEPKVPKFDPYTGKPLEEKEEKKEEKKEDKKETPMTDPRIDSIDMNERKKVIDAVEKKFGYTKVSDDKRKEIRKAVGAQFREWGMDIATVPVDKFEANLANAYFLVGVNSLPEDDKKDTAVADLLAARDADAGALPSMSSQAENKDTTKISAEQQKWSKKLEVPEDKVSAMMKELTDNGVATYKPKEDKKEDKQVIPSGTPNEPAS